MTMKGLVLAGNRSWEVLPYMNSAEFLTIDVYHIHVQAFANIHS